MIRPLRELPEVLDAARAGEPVIEAGLLEHRAGARLLARELPAFGPAVVHRALLAQLTFAASRIVAPAPLVDAAGSWVVCPCPEHEADLRVAIDESTPRPDLPIASMIGGIAAGTRPAGSDALAEGFDLAASRAGTQFVVDAVIAELRAWLRTDPRAARAIDDHRAALQAAATEGDAEAVRARLASMGLTRSTWHQLTADDRHALDLALLTGVRLHHRDVVAALLDAGVPSNTQGSSPLAALAGWDDEDVPLVRTLVHHGASPHGNLRYEQPVHDAVTKGWTDTVKALLADGADVDRRDGAGRTALHLAAAGDHPDLVGLLLRFGAWPLARDRGGALPVDLAGDATRAVLDAATRAALADPSLPPLRRELRCVAVVGDRTLVTAGSALQRWDVGDPVRPEVLDHVHLDRSIRRTLVVGDRIVCVGEGAVQPRPDILPPGYPYTPRHDIGVEVRAIDGLGLAVRTDVPGTSAGASVAASPDGRSLAVGGGYALVLLDAETLHVIADVDPDGDIEQVAALAFHPDGRHLVAITTDIYGGWGQIDVFAVEHTEEGVTLGPQVTALAPPNESLRDERWYATGLAFDRAGSDLYAFGTHGVGRGRIERLDWSTDDAGEVTLTPRWTARGDDLLVLDDDTVLVQTEPLHLHVLDAADGSVRQEIELDRPMVAPAMARDSTGRVWIAGGGGLTFTDALRG